MPRRVIEITGEGKFIHCERGFVVASDLKDGKTHVAKAPIVSQGLLSRLAAERVVLVVTGSNQNPASMLVPVVGNSEQAGRVDAQIGASVPLRKQLWRKVVQEKIRQQAKILMSAGKSNLDLLPFAARVKSGDPENLEAQVARRYWGELFGPGFRRDREQAGLNAALNYGYTVLRSAVARSVVGSGLLPSQGLFHRSSSNPFRLVDDLIEPFRPFVDLEVFDMAEQLSAEPLSRECRGRLVTLLQHDLFIAGENRTVTMAIQSAVNALVRAYEEKEYSALTFGLSGPTEDQLLRRNQISDLGYVE
ncbi:MAG: type II CRISPR-associated endonuclease Cas1 [Actinobacteria bacterium]|nr:type II CRISPR-associated endonuclease Cas1 [Actinomycetota bacterium]